MNLTFRSDIRHRKQFFTGVSFSHPAKMMLPLELWLIENYTKPGEVILDPMAGSGTLLVACSMGRHVIAVELEQKFVDMMKGNWAKIQERGPMMGYTMGTAKIICGDARNLTGILADRIITSPPYAEINNDNRKVFNNTIGKQGRSNIGRVYSENGDNLGNLPYGSIDAVISSPPYAEAKIDKRHNPKFWKHPNQHDTKHRFSEAIIENPSNLGNLSYGSMDAILTSPPYEGSVSASSGGERDHALARQREKRLFNKGYDPVKYQGGVGRNMEVDFQYSKAAENIGNLKSDSYLAAMLTVYQNCHSVLKAGGLMILVVKPFIRNKQVIRLEEDTRKLCEQAGFVFVEQHVRKLTNMSFWRTIYYQKNPTVERVDKEYILIFAKEVLPL